MFRKEISFENLHSIRMLKVMVSNISSIASTFNLSECLSMGKTDLLMRNMFS